MSSGSWSPATGFVAAVIDALLLVAATGCDSGTTSSGPAMNAAAGSSGTTPSVPSGTTNTQAVTGTVKAVGAGAFHSCAMKQDGTVWCWGLSTQGQVGNSSPSDAAVDAPVVVTLDGAPSALGIGPSTSCVVMVDGTVWCWGQYLEMWSDNSGATGTNTPYPIPGLETATSLAVGADHGCALLQSGQVKCWGSPAYGMLGDGAPLSGEAAPTLPVLVADLSGATAVAVGDAHSCALLSDGSVRCWGVNTSGQIGTGCTDLTPACHYNVKPASVVGVTGATAIACGSTHTCAVTNLGKVLCWGQGMYGVLGNGSTASSYTPVEVVGITDAISISLGAVHSCALLKGGTVKCWGDNSNYKLTAGHGTSSSVPVEISGITGVAQISAGNDHTCVTLDTGTAWCWGSNLYGQSRNGASWDSVSLPTMVVGL